MKDEHGLIENESKNRPGQTIVDVHDRSCGTIHKTDDSMLHDRWKQSQGIVEERNERKHSETMNVIRSRLEKICGVFSLQNLETKPNCHNDGAQLLGRTLRT